MAFDPAEHFIKLERKDKFGKLVQNNYLPIAHRIVWLRDVNPKWAIVTDCLECTENSARFKATVLDETGNVIATGHGSETAGDFKDFYEKAESKAVGRAAAYAGFGTAYAAELDEGDRIVDTPQPPKAAPTPKPIPVPRPAPSAPPAEEPDITLEAARAFVVPGMKGELAGKPLSDYDMATLGKIMESTKASVRLKVMAAMVLEQKELGGEGIPDEPLQQEQLGV